MPPLVECARARATLGEMTAALEGVHGRYRPSALAW
jgi:methylmalonyl-CoA mutase N-terminal domain/subunit